MAKTKFLSAQKTKKAKIWLARIFDIAKVIIIIVMVFYLVHFFLLTIFIVEGASMEPNFYDKEYLFINKIIKEPERGDIIVFRFPGERETKYIKRVIGLAGETIEIRQGAVFVNGQKLLESYLVPGMVTAPLGQKTEWKIGKNEIFVLGDNRENSNDSRVWGALPKNDLIGRAVFIISPSKWGQIFRPDYL